MLSRLLIACVRAYQVVLGPHIGACCRFEPSCSHYGIEALHIHGPWRGLWLTGRRLLRCRPFGPWGFDPVPPPPGPRTPDPGPRNPAPGSRNPEPWILKK